MSVIGVVYVIIVGVSVFFSVLMIGMVWLDRTEDGWDNE